METLTLSQLKRDIVVGREVSLIEFLERRDDEENFRNIDIKSQLKKRIISQTRQTSFALGTECNDKKVNSWVEYPKAQDVSYFIDGVFSLTLRNEAGRIWQKRTYKILK